MTDKEYEEALRFADELDKEGTIACGGFDESKLSTVQRAEYICLQEIERKAWTKLIVDRFARIRKEAREEAADVAVEWVRSKGGYPYDERYEFDIDPETFDDELRAAILKEATE